MLYSKTCEHAIRTRACLEGTTLAEMAGGLKRKRALLEERA
jgi:hypothetical protein